MLKPVQWTAVRCLVLLPMVMSATAHAAAPIDTSCWKTADEHLNMQQQLGITRLRPGPSGNESAPNAANYDEALANPFPDLPEVLKLANGRTVTTAGQWRTQRRPEIVELFEREVVGRIPRQVPKVRWSIVESATAKVGERAVNARRVQGQVDNSGYPALEVNIDMVLVTPADAKGPVPVMILFGGGRMPGAPPPARLGGPPVDPCAAPAPAGAAAGPRAGGPPPGGARAGGPPA